MLKILAIVGSPRKGKNNDTLVEHMLKGMRDTNITKMSIEKLYADKLDVSSCKACDACAKKRGCILQDDMKELYKKFDEADIVILSSPLYFNSISGKVKTIIDRNQAIWSSKYVLGESLIDKEKSRLGYFICTAGMPESPELFDATLPIIDLFFKSINTEHKGNLFVANVDEVSVLEDKKILEKANAIGTELIKNAIDLN